MDYQGLVKRLNLPIGWAAPTELTNDDIRASVITRDHLHDDVRGINASIELIRRTDFDLFLLRERAEKGDNAAIDELIELAGERGDMDELRRLADKGNATATDQLIELATERGDMDELRRLADNGNTTAAEQLMELSAERPL